ncbi:hypothetical protein ACJIZ3_016461 [Penstemon smallii]|uniref:Uncharacterized protein n=1 Tax=Penstemon smallii TaxID=265156 RepID=A0ABD3RQP8_9LAMI
MGLFEEMTLNEYAHLKCLYTYSFISYKTKLITGEPVERVDLREGGCTLGLGGEMGLLISGADFERGIGGLGIEELRLEGLFLLTRRRNCAMRDMKRVSSSSTKCK